MFMGIRDLGKQVWLDWPGEKKKKKNHSQRFHTFRCAMNVPSMRRTRALLSTGMEIHCLLSAPDQSKALLSSAVAADLVFAGLEYRCT